MAFWLCFSGLAAAGDLLRHPNGLRATVEPVAGAPTFEIATAFAVGTADDPAGAEGLAHGVEHLWFQTRLGAERVGDRYRQLGCTSNAWTGGEVMSFLLSCPPAAFADALALEAARFRTWDLDPGDIPREWRVLAMEEAERGDRRTIVEREFLDRQLLPASHPVRLRAARPALGPPPSAETVRGFVAQHFVPGRAALVLAGAVDPTAARTALTTLFGAPVPAPDLPPLRPPPVVRETLRLAPRVVHGVTDQPAVYVAWSQPRPEGLSGAAIDLYLELWLRLQVEQDPRVLDVECGSSDVLFVRTLWCRLAARGDAEAEGLGQALPGVLARLGHEKGGEWLVDAAQGQNWLWSLLLTGRRGADPGALAHVVARNLVEGSRPDAARARSLGDFIAGARLADTALVLILTGDGPRRAPRSWSPAPELGPAPPLVVPRPSAAEPLAVAERTLPNGVRLVAVQRPGTLVMHAAVYAATDGSAVAARAGYGRQALVARDAWRGDVLELDRGMGPEEERTLVTVPPHAAEAARMLLEGLQPIQDDALQAERALLLIERFVRTAPHEARVWAWLVPGWATSPTVRPELAAVRAATPDAVARARTSLYAPDRTTVAIVGPEPPEQALAPFVVAFSGWAAPARAAGVVPAPFQPTPGGVYVPAEGSVSWVGTACPTGVRAGALAVYAALVNERLVAELRERRAVAYSPAAFGDEGQLRVMVGTDPSEAGAALEVVRAALAQPADADALAAALASATGPDAPDRWAPADLAAALAGGSVRVDEVATWTADARAVGLPGLAEMAGRCEAGLAWAAAGPEGSVVPEGTPRADPTSFLPVLGD